MDKQDFILGSSFVIANTALVSLTGDWFFFKGGPHTVNVSNTSSCLVYDKESYNMFGAVCGVNLGDIEPFVGTLQVLLPINCVFALLLFFLVALKRMRKRIIKVTCLVILALSVTIDVMWLTHERKNLPTSDDIIGTYGAGWFLTAATGVSTIPLFFI